MLPRGIKPARAHKRTFHLLFNNFYIKSSKPHTVVSNMATSTLKYACRLEDDAIKIFRTEPATYRDKSLTIEFMRTIRVPENAPATTLPSGLGKFPLSKVSDYTDKPPTQVPADRGVFFAMHRK